MKIKKDDKMSKSVINKDIINTQIFNQKMREIKNLKDKESRHFKADKLLCDTLKSLGYTKDIRIYNKIYKYYA